MRKYKEKNTYSRLFQTIEILENDKCFIEDEEYKKFIVYSLKNLIDKCSI